MELNQYKSKKRFTQEATQTIESVISQAIQKNGQARVALSGGNSPRPIYQALSQCRKIDWSKVQVYLVDERYVPEDSDESNAKMIREVLIDHIPEVEFYPFQTDLSIHQAVEKYKKQLHSIQKQPLFDLVILGLGNDGHTASLFPDIPELDEKEKWVVATKAKNYPTEDRLSLTFPAILNSQKVMFLIQGNKDQIVQKWLEEAVDFHQLPAKKILEHDSLEVFYFKDN